MDGLTDLPEMKGYTLLGVYLDTTDAEYHYYDDPDCRGYDRCHDCCCSLEDIMYVKKVVTVWVEGRPIGPKPCDANFHIRIWNLTEACFTLRTWNTSKAFAIFTGRVPESSFTLAATVDPQDQEFSYRDMLKPYVNKSNHIDLMSPVKDTFRATSSRDKYLGQFNQCVSYLMTGFERAPEPENPHVNKRKRGTSHETVSKS